MTDSIYWFSEMREIGEYSIYSHHSHSGFNVIHGGHIRKVSYLFFTEFGMMRIDHLQKRKYKPIRAEKL